MLWLRSKFFIRNNIDCRILLYWVTFATVYDNRKRSKVGLKDIMRVESKEKEYDVSLKEPCLVKFFFKRNVGRRWLLLLLLNNKEAVRI